MTSTPAQSGSGKANTSPGSVLKRIVSTQLPFTGLPLGIWLLLGLALIGLGTLLKRRGRLGGALLAATSLFLLQAAAAAGSTPKLTPTEHSFLWAVNQARTQHGSPTVALDRRLLQAARYHSRDMIQRQYFAHGDFARLIEAASIAEATSVLGERAIDLVLTDIVMPGGSGRELAESRDVRGSHAPIIYMSGYTEETVSRQELAAADARFLEKPFAPAALLAAVSDALSADR